MKKSGIVCGEKWPILLDWLHYAYYISKKTNARPVMDVHKNGGDGAAPCLYTSNPVRPIASDKRAFIYNIFND